MEVRLRRGLDAVGAAAEVDRVEVVLEDLVLGLLPVDLDRDEQLLGLPGERPVLAEEVVLDVLLGDRRATLGRLAALDRHPDRPGDAGRADRRLVVEVVVLGREDRVLHRLGDLVQRHRLPVDLRDAVHLGLAVGVVDDRRLGRRVVVRLRRVDERIGDAEPRDAEDEQPGEDEQDPLGPAHLLAPPALAGAPLRRLCRLGLEAGRGLALAHEVFRVGGRADRSRRARRTPPV